MLRIALPLILVLALAAPLAPSVGAEDVQPMELRGTAPAWWTPETMAATDAAAEEGKLLNPLTGETFTWPQAAAVLGIPAGSPDYLFVRPGALYLSANLALCTTNFVYDDLTRIGTAGHCVEKNGERAYILAAPTVPLVTTLGTVATHQNGGIGNDYALININAQWQPFVDPGMAYVGGPSCSEWGGASSLAKHAGHGIQTGLVAAVPRVSLVDWSTGSSFSGKGEVSGGDSGSGIISITGCTLGSAAGIITHCASLTGFECLPLFWATDIRSVPGTVSTTVV